MILWTLAKSQGVCPANSASFLKCQRARSWRLFSLLEITAGRLGWIFPAIKLEGYRVVQAWALCSGLLFSKYGLCSSIPDGRLYPSLAPSILCAHRLRHESQTSRDSPGIDVRLRMLRLVLSSPAPQSVAPRSFHSIHLRSTVFRSSAAPVGLV